MVNCMISHFFILYSQNFTLILFIFFLFSSSPVHSSVCLHTSGSLSDPDAPSVFLVRYLLYYIHFFRFIDQLGDTRPRHIQIYADIAYFYRLFDCPRSRTASMTCINKFFYNSDLHKSRNLQNHKKGAFKQQGTFSVQILFI